MRKYKLLTFSLFFCLIANTQSRKLEIDSKITSVTLYLSGAQVNRTAKTTLSPGKTELIFNGISPLLDKQSVQVKAEGKVTVLSVIHQLNYLKEQEVRTEIQEIDHQKAALTEKINQEKNIYQVFKQEEIMLLKNQEIKGSQATLKTAELKEAVDFQRTRLTEVYQRIAEIEKQIRKWENEIARLQAQLIALNEKKDKSTSEIIVTVSSKEAIQAAFQLSYMVQNAGWYPSYDVRVKDITQPILFQYKANIRQSSGEDWKEVKLALSTGNPKENHTRPQLSPWYLRYLAYVPVMSPSSSIGGTGSGLITGRVTDDSGQPVGNASVSLKGTSKGTVTDANGFYSISAPQGSSVLMVSSVGFSSIETKASPGTTNIMLKEKSQALTEVVVTGYGYSDTQGYPTGNNYSVTRKKEENAIGTTTYFQPTTTVYEIEEPYTVLNDGKTYTADINQYELAATYEYYAVPRLDPAAYLTARITNWQELNLLPGEASLFFEGSYLGKSLLDVYNAGDTLPLSLGKDKGIVIRKTVLKEFSQKKFMGSHRTDTRQYEILVRNNKNVPVNLMIEDQFPISTGKEIEVDNKKAPEARIEENTEKITWIQVIPPAREARFTMGFTVKYPKEKRLQLD